MRIKIQKECTEILINLGNEDENEPLTKVSMETCKLQINKKICGLPLLNKKLGWGMRVGMSH